MLRRTFLTMTLAAGLAAAADPALLNMIPKDPQVIAGIDFVRAKSSPFGQRILAEIKDEDKGLKELIESTGFDPRRDLREVVMASDGKTGERTVILVRGTFDQSKINALLGSQGGAKSIYNGVELWTNGKSAKPDGTVAIVDSSLAIFGKDAAVREAIDRRSASGSALSADLQRRINEWSANDAWFITTASFAEMGINKDGKNRVMPNGLSSDAIRSASAGVRFSKDVQVSGEALTRSEQDAQALVDVFKFITSMIRLNSDKPQASEALKIAESMQVSISGATVKFSLAIPEEMLDKMLEKKTQRAERAARKRDVI